MTRIRPATAADASAVAALEEYVFGADAWPRAAVAEELAGPMRQAYVAVDGHRVCGYVMVRAAGKVLDLQRIAVAGDRRRAGVAGALLDACDVSGFDRMLLEVRADNEPALRFYRERRFDEISRRPAYYADGADAVVLQQELSPAADR